MNQRKTYGGRTCVLVIFQRNSFHLYRTGGSKNSWQPWTICEFQQSCPMGRFVWCTHIHACLPILSESYQTATIQPNHFTTIIDTAGLHYKICILNPFSAKNELTRFGPWKWQNNLKSRNQGISRDFWAKWMCSTFNFESETTRRRFDSPRSLGFLIFFSDFWSFSSIAWHWTC